MKLTLSSGIAFWYGLLVGLSVSILLIAAIGCKRGRPPCRYYIPHDYEGWVLIQFNVDGAVPLRKDNGHCMIEVPLSGRLSIPGEPEYGWARDEYYYVDERGALEELPITPSGGGGLIWGIGVGSYRKEGLPEFSAEHFFVGPESEFEKAPTLHEVMAIESRELRRIGFLRLSWD